MEFPGEAGGREAEEEERLSTVEMVPQMFALLIIVPLIAHIPSPQLYKAGPSVYMSFYISHPDLNLSIIKSVCITMGHTKVERCLFYN